MMTSDRHLLSVYQMAWQMAPRRVRRTPARPVPPFPSIIDSSTPEPLRPVINFDKPIFPDSPRIVGRGY
ncbi:hypothetical protein [Hymenobacter canadensis]|uniref:Uncharacterized protein n=1 Tax=Hymenobacter canadensis TaxID=2999067 RepID=A0ABY7LKJ9_9BACT|nr:hypothetical protein [Hymenobacter canadensis]WBA40969.1 hypothetical protein O3303_14190 [Hymenobacter canadensis]